MDVKDFVKSILVQLDEAVDEVRSKTSRDVSFAATEGRRTIEFDIAVTAEDASSVSGKAGIKVMSVLEGGGDISKESKSSYVSRVQFGLHVQTNTKEEQAAQQAALRSRKARSSGATPFFETSSF